MFNLIVTYSDSYGRVETSQVRAVSEKRCLNASIADGALLYWRDLELLAGKSGEGMLGGLVLGLNIV